MGILALLGGLFFLGVPILSIVALVRSADLKSRLLTLDRKVQRLNKEVKALESDRAASPASQNKQSTPAAAPSEATPQPVQTPAPTSPPSPDASRTEKPVIEKAQAVPASATTKPSASAALQAAKKSARQGGAPAGSKESWFPETIGAANWLIIAGGVALACAAGFLIKYSVEEGWLGPTARVIIGGLAGIGLLVFGDIVRRKPLGRGAAILQSDTMPATLTGAGLVALFASVYGAYALYGLIAPLTTIVLLVLICLTALALSFFHGAIIAGLGMSGAYIVPLIVDAGDTSQIALFGYLFAVTGTVVAMGRFRLWSWAPVGGLIACTLWTLLAIVDAGGLRGGDTLMVFWFGLFWIYALVPGLEITGKGQDEASLPARAISLLGISAGLLSAAITIGVFLDEGRASLASILLALLIVSNVGLAWRDERKLPHLFVGCAAALTVVFTWDLLALFFDPVLSQVERTHGWPRLPREVGNFAQVAAAVAILFTGSGIARAVMGKTRAGLWSATGISVALVTLMAVYLRINGLEHSLSWAMMAAGLALVFLFAAIAVRARAPGDLGNAALAAYAIGVLAALSLGAGLAFERVWLTISLALMIPGIAWVYTRIPIPILRRLVMIVGLAVLARLFLNPFVMSYEIVEPLIFNWLLYGYGVPAAAFFVAARLLKRDDDDLTVQILEAGALVFSVVCVTTQARLFIHEGDLRSTTYLLSEACLNTIIWASFAYALFRKAGPDASVVINVGTRVMMGLSLTHIGLIHIVILNPYWTGEAVGNWPVINLLLLAYVVPAVILSAFHLPWHRARLAMIFGNKGALVGVGLISVSTFVLGLIYISLEVTRAFHGSVLTEGPKSDGELYTYSLVWLLYAGSLMGVGIWQKNHFIRMAAMAVIALSTLKIFWLDMASLEGLMRVLSFFGLAVSLLAIGYLYQRFVITEVKSANAEPEI